MAGRGMEGSGRESPASGLDKTKMVLLAQSFPRTTMVPKVIRTDIETTRISPRQVRLSGYVSPAQRQPSVCASKVRGMEGSGRESPVSSLDKTKMVLLAQSFPRTTMVPKVIRTDIETTRISPRQKSGQQENTSDSEAQGKSKTSTEKSGKGPVGEHTTLSSHEPRLTRRLVRSDPVARSSSPRSSPRSRLHRSDQSKDRMGLFESLEKFRQDSPQREEQAESRECVPSGHFERLQGSLLTTSIGEPQDLDQEGIVRTRQKSQVANAHNPGIDAEADQCPPEPTLRKRRNDRVGETDDKTGEKKEDNVTTTRRSIRKDPVEATDASTYPDSKGKMRTRGVGTGIRTPPIHKANDVTPVRLAHNQSDFSRPRRSRQSASKYLEEEHKVLQDPRPDQEEAHTGSIDSVVDLDSTNPVSSCDILASLGKPELFPSLAAVLKKHQRKDNPLSAFQALLCPHRIRVFSSVEEARQHLPKGNKQPLIRMNKLSNADIIAETAQLKAPEQPRSPSLGDNIASTEAGGVLCPNTKSPTEMISKLSDDSGLHLSEKSSALTAKLGHLIGEVIDKSFSAPKGNMKPQTSEIVQRGSTQSDTVTQDHDTHQVEDVKPPQKDYDSPSHCFKELQKLLSPTGSPRSLALQRELSSTHLSPPGVVLQKTAVDVEKGLGGKSDALDEILDDNVKIDVVYEGTVDVVKKGRCPVPGKTQGAKSKEDARSKVSPRKSPQGCVVSQMSPQGSLSPAGDTTEDVVLLVSPVRSRSGRAIKLSSVAIEAGLARESSISFLMGGPSEKASKIRKLKGPQHLDFSDPNCNPTPKITSPNQDKLTMRPVGPGEPQISLLRKQGPEQEEVAQTNPNQYRPEQEKLAKMILPEELSMIKLQPEICSLQMKNHEGKKEKISREISSGDVNTQNQQGRCRESPNSSFSIIKSTQGKQGERTDSSTGWFHHTDLAKRSDNRSVLDDKNTLCSSDGKQIIQETEPKTDTEDLAREGMRMLDFMKGIEIPLCPITADDGSEPHTPKEAACVPLLGFTGTTEDDEAEHQTQEPRSKKHEAVSQVPLKDLKCEQQHEKPKDEEKEEKIGKVDTRRETVKDDNTFNAQEERSTLGDQPSSEVPNEINRSMNSLDKDKSLSAERQTEDIAFCSGIENEASDQIELLGSDSQLGKNPDLSSLIAQIADRIKSSNPVLDPVEDSPAVEEEGDEGQVELDVSRDSEKSDTNLNQETGIAAESEEEDDEEDESSDEEEDEEEEEEEEEEEDESADSSGSEVGLGEDTEQMTQNSRTTTSTICDEDSIQGEEQQRQPTNEQFKEALSLTDPEPTSPSPLPPTPSDLFLTNDVTDDQTDTSVRKSDCLPENSEEQILEVEKENEQNLVLRLSESTSCTSVSGEKVDIDDGELDNQDSNNNEGKTEESADDETNLEEQTSCGRDSGDLQTPVSSLNLHIENLIKNTLASNVSTGTIKEVKEKVACLEDEADIACIEPKECSDSYGHVISSDDDDDDDDDDKIIREDPPSALDHENKPMDTNKTVEVLEEPQTSEATVALPEAELAVSVLKAVQSRPDIFTMVTNISPVKEDPVKEIIIQSDSDEENQMPSRSGEDVSSSSKQRQTDIVEEKFHLFEKPGPVNKKKASAFISDELDEYLKENSKLRRSFPKDPDLFKQPCPPQQYTQAHLHNKPSARPNQNDPDIDEIDGILFYSFMSKYALDIHMTKAGRRKSSQNALSGISEDTPDKTHDVTKIKGWKKKFGSSGYTLTSQQSPEELLHHSKLQSMNLHWKTQEKMLRNMSVQEIKYLGLNLKRRRRRFPQYTHRKGATSRHQKEDDVAILEGGRGSMRSARKAWLSKVRLRPVTVTPSMALSAVTALSVKSEQRQSKVQSKLPCDKPGCRYGCICHLCQYSESAGSDSDGLSEEVVDDPQQPTCLKEYCRLGCICEWIEDQPSSRVKSGCDFCHHFPCLCPSGGSASEDDDDDPEQSTSGEPGSISHNMVTSDAIIKSEVLDTPDVTETMGNSRLPGLGPALAQTSCEWAKPKRKRRRKFLSVKREQEQRQTNIGDSQIHVAEDLRNKEFAPDRDDIKKSPAGGEPGGEAGVPGRMRIVSEGESGKGEYLKMFGLAKKSELPPKSDSKPVENVRKSKRLEGKKKGIGNIDKLRDLIFFDPFVWLGGQKKKRREKPVKEKNTVTPHGRGVSSAVESGTRMVPSGKGKGSQKVPALKGPKPGPWHPAGLSKTHLNQGFLKHPKGRAGAGMDFTVKEEPEDINESCEDEPLSVQDEVGGDVYQYDLPQRNNKQIIWSGGSTGKGKKEPGCGHQFHHHLSISEKIIFVQTEMKDSDVDVTSVDEVPVLSTLGLDRGFDKSEGAGFMLRGQVLAAQLNHQRIVIYFVMAAQEESELRSQNEQTVQSQPSQSHHNVVHFSWKAGTQCENSARRHCVAPKVFYTSSKSDSVKENLRRVYCIVLEIQASAPQEVMHMLHHGTVEVMGESHQDAQEDMELEDLGLIDDENEDTFVCARTQIYVPMQERILKVEAGNTNTMPAKKRAKLSTESRMHAGKPESLDSLVGKSASDKLGLTMGKITGPIIVPMVPAVRPPMTARPPGGGKLPVTRPPWPQTLAPNINPTPQQREPAFKTQMVLLQKNHARIQARKKFLEQQNNKAEGGGEVGGECSKDEKLNEMLSLKGDKVNDKIPHLLEIQSNCNWGDIRSDLLSQISIIADKGDIPPPGHKLRRRIGDFNVAVLPRPIKKTKLPMNLQFQLALSSLQAIRLVITRATPPPAGPARQPLSHPPTSTYAVAQKTDQAAAVSQTKSKVTDSVEPTPDVKTKIAEMVKQAKQTKEELAQAELELQARMASHSNTQTATTGISGLGRLTIRAPGMVQTAGGGLTVSVGDHQNNDTGNGRSLVNARTALSAALVKAKGFDDHTQFRYSSTDGCSVGEVAPAGIQSGRDEPPVSLMSRPTATITSSQTQKTFVTLTHSACQSTISPAQGPGMSLLKKPSNEPHSEDTGEAEASVVEAPVQTSLESETQTNARIMPIVIEPQECTPDRLSLSEKDSEGQQSIASAASEATTGELELQLDSDKPASSGSASPAVTTEKVSGPPVDRCTSLSPVPGAADQPLLSGLTGDAAPSTFTEHLPREESGTEPMETNQEKTRKRRRESNTSSTSNNETPGRLPRKKSRRQSDKSMEAKAQTEPEPCSSFGIPLSLPQNTQPSGTGAGETPFPVALYTSTTSSDPKPVSASPPLMTMGTVPQGMPRGSPPRHSIRIPLSALAASAARSSTPGTQHPPPHQPVNPARPAFQLTLPFAVPGKPFAGAQMINGQMCVPVKFCPATGTGSTASTGTPLTKLDPKRLQLQAGSTGGGPCGPIIQLVPITSVSVPPVQSMLPATSRAAPAPTGLLRPSGPIQNILSKASDKLPLVRKIPLPFPKAVPAQGSLHVEALPSREMAQTRQPSEKSVDCSKNSTSKDAGSSKVTEDSVSLFSVSQSNETECQTDTANCTPFSSPGNEREHQTDIPECTSIQSVSPEHEAESRTDPSRCSSLLSAILEKEPDSISANLTPCSPTSRLNKSPRLGPAELKEEEEEDDKEKRVGILLSDEDREEVEGHSGQDAVREVHDVMSLQDPMYTSESVVVNLTEALQNPESPNVLKKALDSISRRSPPRTPRGAMPDEVSQGSTPDLTGSEVQRSHPSHPCDIVSSSGSSRGQSLGDSGCSDDSESDLNVDILSSEEWQVPAAYLLRHAVQLDESGPMGPAKPVKSKRKQTHEERMAPSTAVEFHEEVVMFDGCKGKSMRDQPSRKQHMARERQRRHDIVYKFLNLWNTLPKSQRPTVNRSMASKQSILLATQNYVRELQTKSRDLRERKKRLLQRREMLVRRIKSLREMRYKSYAAMTVNEEIGASIIVKEPAEIEQFSPEDGSEEEGETSTPMEVVIEDAETGRLTAFREKGRDVQMWLDENKEATVLGPQSQGQLVTETFLPGTVQEMDYPYGDVSLTDGMRTNEDNGTLGLTISAIYSLADDGNVKSVNSNSESDNKSSTSSKMNVMQETETNCDVKSVHSVEEDITDTA